MSNVATLAGHVTVEDHAVIGGLAAVHQFCRVGRLSIIGGCSKVVQDVPPFMMADGNPAQTRTLNKVGLERKGIGPESQAALKQAYRILFREGLTTSNAIKRIEETVPAVDEIRHLAEFIKASERGILK
jgi:UDP-N-acetylglucosamine acyltransferase